MGRKSGAGEDFAVLRQKLVVGDSGGGAHFGEELRGIPFLEHPFGEPLFLAGEYLVVPFELPGLANEPVPERSFLRAFCLRGVSLGGGWAGVGRWSTTKLYGSERRSIPSSRRNCSQRAS